MADKPKDDELHDREEKPTIPAKSQKRPSIWTRLPPWVSTNLRSLKSWKLLFRCWLAAWVAFILILPNKSLETLGNAAFFALLVSLMLPPNMPVHMFMLAISLLVLGLLLGWGFGAAAMRAALAARDQTLLKRTLQKVESSAAGLANPDALFQVAIFKGEFLDVRSSIVFGCFLGFSTFCFALLRSYAPKLTFTSIFATIAIDVFCSYGPLFPFAEYTILNSILISVGCYMALAIIVITFVFPETINHASLSATSDIIQSIQDMVSVQSEVLVDWTDADREEKLKRGSPLRMKLEGMRAKAIGQYQGLGARSKFIDLEFSWGRWNGGDITDLQEPLITLAVRIAGLLTFSRLLGHPYNRAPPPLAPSDTTSESSDQAQRPGPTETSSADMHLYQQVYRSHVSAEEAHSLRISDMIPILREATEELRNACVDALSKTRACVDAVNTRRWKKDRGAVVERTVEELDVAIVALGDRFEEFKSHQLQALIGPYKPVLEQYRKSFQDDSEATARPLLPIRALHIAYVFSSNLITSAESTLVLCRLVRATAERRKRNRLWAPKGLRAIGKVILSKDADVEGGKALGEDVMEVDEARNDTRVEKMQKVSKLDPDSRQPANVLQKVINFIHVLYKWTKTPEALFSIKYVVLSILLWLPSVFPSSAYFNYVQKGLWALIMGQLTLNVYASDQIFNYVTRLLGTLVGLVFGLVAWYIGSGSGPGNRYGLAATMAVLLIPVMFLRVFSPPQYLSGVITGASTFALIVGYSWIDANLPMYGNPGTASTIAWKRWVLVVIGSAASFIVMMVPPKSSRKAVRLRNSGTITGIANLYAIIISAWTDTSELSDNEESPDARTEQWKTEFRTDIVALAGQVEGLKQMTVMAKWEGNIRGKWPSNEYTRLVTVQSDMLASLSQLASSLSHLNSRWRSSIIHHTRVLNPDFISDVFSTFTLVSQSLYLGQPMHSTIRHSLLDRLVYHHRNHRALHSTGIQDLLDIQQLQSLDYVYYSTALIAMFELLTSLDELHDITRSLCGDISLPGYEHWRREYSQHKV